MRAVAPESRTSGFVTFSASTVTEADDATAKNFMDRIEAYIPAEVIAFYIFVNSSVIGISLSAPGKRPGCDAPAVLNQQTPACDASALLNQQVSAVEPDVLLTMDGYVAIATLVVGVLLSILYAYVAAKRSREPWVVQAIVTALAFLVWSYALGGRGYDALQWDVVPSLAGLLIATFTVVSGFVVPVKKV